MGARKKSKTSPSRQRYLDSHPSVSVRMDQDTHNLFREVLEANGISAGEWFRARLSEDRAAIEAQHRLAAARRDGLAEEMRSLTQQRDALRAEVESQHRRVKVSVEVAKAQMLEEAKREVAAEADQARWRYREELQQLADKVRAANMALEEAGEELATKRREAGTLDVAIRLKRTTVQSYMRQAVEELRKRGVPAMQCLQCPAYQFYQRTVGGILQAVTATAPAASPPPEKARESAPPVPSVPPDQAKRPLQGPKVG